MKCLTIQQPWASLIAVGAKKFETRSWPPNHRGTLAIHAGLRRARHERANGPVTRAALAAAGIEDPEGQLPRGRVIAVTRLVAVHRTEDVRPILGWDQLALGDYADGRFAWELELVRRLEEPVPARGRLGLWEWEET
jgi:activating signal cointegrator 1